MEEYKLKNHLPDLITECGEKQGKELLQRDIAQEIGMQEATLSRYINGYVSGAKFDIEAKLCQFFSNKLGRPIGRDDLFSFDFETAS